MKYTISIETDDVKQVEGLFALLQSVDAKEMDLLDISSPVLLGALLQLGRQLYDSVGHSNKFTIEQALRDPSWMAQWSELFMLYRNVEFAYRRRLAEFGITYTER